MFSHKNTLISQVTVLATLEIKTPSRTSIYSVFILLLHIPFISFEMRQFKSVGHFHIKVHKKIYSKHKQIIKSSSFFAIFWSPSAYFSMINVYLLFLLKKKFCKLFLISWRICYIGLGMFSMYINHFTHHRQ